MKQSKLVKVIILFFIILLVVIAGLGYAYIKTDLFKTPDQLFKKYLINGAVQVSKFNLEPYSEFSERIKNEKAEIVSEEETEYIPETSSGYYSNFYKEETEEVQKLLVNETIKLDIANKNIAYLIDVKNNKKDFLKVNILKTDDTYGVFIPEVHEKYLAIENRDFKKIAQTFGASDEIVEYIPNELPKITFSEEEMVRIKELVSKYGNKISDSIDTSLYTKEKYEMVNFEGENITGNKYILTISEDKLGEILKDTYSELKNDQEFANIIEGNIIKLYVDYINAMMDFSETLYDSILNTDAPWSTTENTVTEETVEEVPENIKFCLYEYKGNTVKFEILSENGDVTEFSINNKETSSHILMRAYEAKTEYNDVASETIYDLSNKYENNNGELVVLVQSKYNQEDIEDVKKEKEDENSYFASFYDDEYYASKYPDKEMNLKLTTNVNGNIANTKVEYTINTGEAANREFDFILKFNPDLKIPILNDENKIVLNDYTMEEFTAFGTELTNNIYKSAEENSETLIGSYIKQKQEEKRAEIEYYKEKVKKDIEESIETNLENYHFDASYDENVNPDDYLTLEKIKEEAGWYIDEIELIDGTILKCLVNDYVFFVEINIDGNEWKLIDTTVLYSEDGTLENAI